jgi:ABC-type Zn uptake system ZnuABC Zn-binding protein ZnuA
MAAVVVSLALGAPFAGPAAARGDRVQVAVSTPLLADIVRNVAGDQAEVFAVMPGDADPHTWEAAPQDIVAATEADSFIYIGAHLEPFVESGGWRRAVQEAGVPQLIVSEHVELIERDMVIDHGDHVHDLRAGDPHIWLDPLKVVENFAGRRTWPNWKRHLPRSHQSDACWSSSTTPTRTLPPATRSRLLAS